MNRPANGLIAGLIFGPLFLVVGYVVAFMFGKPILDNARASRDWPQVTGTITKSEVHRSRKKGSTMYSAEVVYDYTVEGKKLEGDTVWFGGNYRTSSDRGARDVVSRYPVGKQVPVFYNPQDPTLAVLESGAFLTSYVVFGIGLAFMIAGGLVTGGMAIKLLLGGLLVGTVVASRISKSEPSPVSSFAPPRPTSAKHPPQHETDDGIQVG